MGDTLQLSDALRGFYKTSPHTTLGIGLHAKKCLVQAMDGASIGAGNDQKIIAWSSLEGDPQFGLHGGSVDDLLATEMATALRRLLILQQQA